MKKVTFARRQFPDFSVSDQANLMDSLLEQKIPVASSCKGEGVCAKCKVKIVEGLGNLSPPSEKEVFLAEKLSFKATERLSCQAKVLGEISIDTTYW